ncbi:MAG: [FeFe] hydrogenase H-cluster maturation GTPase HydF [Lentisphaerae bacterium]|jgi:[FeFe] hydrogenase H-cluster maturation GTPase HydF|nr:[FeFe] hydrogenase H-cluster maturation GTPase HydF [Lentisphaerota bacterium]
MERTPKSMRRHIGLFGRANVGKSTFLNLLTGQDVAITSSQPGTTTDPVEKTMELPPLGPVIITDTGGVDDASPLGPQRRQRMQTALRRMDVAVLILEPDVWTGHEDLLLRDIQAAGCPVLAVVAKTDLQTPAPAFMDKVRERVPTVLESSLEPGRREALMAAFKEALGRLLPAGGLSAPDFYGGALPAGGLVLLVVTVDSQAPQGRLIMPQVQAIRAALDAAAMVTVVRESELPAVLERLAAPPDLVVCDSQVVGSVLADLPAHVPCTTFSIALARLKGDLPAMVRAARVINDLHDGDRILIGEACSHHALEDDIGRRKIPRWLREKTGKTLDIDVVSGRDWPENLADYRLVIHCGACMLNPREMRHRLEEAAAHRVPVSNYGIVIAFLKDVLPRVIEPFPDALTAYYA